MVRIPRLIEKWAPPSYRWVTEHGSIYSIPLHPAIQKNNNNSILYNQTKEYNHHVPNTMVDFIPSYLTFQLTDP